MDGRCIQSLSPLGFALGFGVVPLAADSRLGGGVVRSWARKFLLQRSRGNRWLEGTTGGRTVIVAWLASYVWEKKQSCQRGSQQQ